MKDLSLHILDIIQNSISAKANLIELTIEENLKDNLYALTFIDNGMGMSDETAKKGSRSLFHQPNHPEGLDWDYHF